MNEHKYRHICDICGAPTDVMYLTDPDYPGELPIEHHRCAKHFRADVNQLIDSTFSDPNSRFLLKEGQLPTMMLNTEQITIAVQKAEDLDDGCPDPTNPAWQSEKPFTQVAILVSNNYTGNVKVFTFKGILTPDLLKTRIGHLIGRVLKDSTYSNEI